MVDRYYRKIEDVENDIENAMQISSILLKLKGYDDDLGKIDTNEGNISTNLEKIDDNLEKINDIKSILPKSEKHTVLKINHFDLLETQFILNY